tara:strand:- start:1506 stop:2567 length:1062 start_codon:yes stop_codon:yes gene_type:complete
METVVIYPGRFHPFHTGHKSSYNFLTSKFGKNNVFVATTSKQAPITSPFSYEEKQVMMNALGIPMDKIVQVRNPYNAEEIVKNFDHDNTVLIYAVSDKDMQRFQFTKKDGTPGYIQPLVKDPKPLSQNAYLVLTPTEQFQVQGKTVRSASELRSMYVKSDQSGRQTIIKDLYGSINSQIKSIFDKALSMNEQFLQGRRATAKLKASLKMENLLRILEQMHIREAYDPMPTGGEEPPQVQPGDMPGTYEYVDIDQLTPVQKVRYRHKQYKAFLRMVQGDYKPLVVDKDYNIVNGHHRYDALRRAKFNKVQVYKIDSNVADLMEKWSAKYKKSIDCSNPKGFSQKAHCAGRKKKK